MREKRPSRRTAQAHGYGAMNFRDLGAEVGIKTVSIYHHFPSKADLGAAVAKRYWEDTASRPEAPSAMCVVGVISRDAMSSLPVTTERFCQSNEKSFGATDVAEPIRVLVPNHFADELCTVLAEPGECFVDVAHSEHSTQVAEGVHRGIPMIGDYRRGEKTRELEAAVAVGGDQHGNLDALIAQSSDASGPFSVNDGSSFKRQAKLGEERDCVIE